MQKQTSNKIQIIIQNEGKGHVCSDSQKSKSDRLSNQKVVTQKRHNFSSRQVQAIECARGEVALGDGRFQ